MKLKILLIVRQPDQLLMAESLIRSGGAMNRQDEYHLKLAVGSINGRRASDPNRKAAGLLLKELSDRHRAGMMIMTCGRPVELLYRLRFDMPYDVWMLRPLFVEDQTPFEGRLKLGDPVKKLHVDYPR